MSRQACGCVLGSPSPAGTMGETEADPGGPRLALALMEPGGKPLKWSQQGSDLDFKTLHSRARVKMENGLECGSRVEAPVKNEFESGNVHSLMEREVLGSAVPGLVL